MKNKIDVEVMVRIYDDLLDPLVNCLTPEVAQRIVECDLPDDVKARMQKLESKFMEGEELPEHEESELEYYRNVHNFISFLQAKTKRLIRGESTRL